MRSIPFFSFPYISLILFGRHSLKLEAPVTILDRRSLMVSSPTFNSELPVKATEVIPETIDLETRSVSTEEIEDEDVQQPAVLEKEETLISAVEILDAGFTATGSTAGTSDVPAALAKNSTINSRRIDSLRYKEKTRIPSSNTMTETPQSLAMKHPAITKEAIASEIDDLFKTILA